MKIKFTWKKSVLLTFLIAGFFLIAMLWFHRVDNSLTEIDKQYIPMFLANISDPSAERTFEEEIEFIAKVQDSVLTVAPLNKGIPYSQEREPKQLYEAKVGLCFDRSRVIEKILRSKGFETRHIFVYSVKDTGSSFRSFITPNVPSHAITEVLTKKGWLVIDSNDRWISMDAQDNPRPMEDLRLNSENSETIEWKDVPPPIYKNIAPYTYVYGLYSRHGKFYPPYNFIPDVHYGELMDNVF